MKPLNEKVLVFKEIIPNVYAPKGEVKHITQVGPKDKICCPECQEPVKNYSKSPRPHYEHFSKEGAKCSFKIANG